MFVFPRVRRGARKIRSAPPAPHVSAQTHAACLSHGHKLVVDLLHHVQRIAERAQRLADHRSHDLPDEHLLIDVDEAISQQVVCHSHLFCGYRRLFSRRADLSEFLCGIPRAHLHGCCADSGNLAFDFLYLDVYLRKIRNALKKYLCHSSTAYRQSENPSSPSLVVLNKSAMTLSVPSAALMPSTSARSARPQPLRQSSSFRQE